MCVCDTSCLYQVQMGILKRHDAPVVALCTKIRKSDLDVSLLLDYFWADVTVKDKKD